MQPSFHPLAAAALALLGLAASMPASAQGRAAGAPEAAGLIVKYRSEQRDAVSARAALQGARASAEARGMHVAFERENAMGAHVLRFERRVPAAAVAQLARELAAADPTIEYVEPDHVVRAHMTPNDPSYAQQWHYFDTTGGINLPGAWAFSTGFGVNVAVVDTGTRPHADLAANLLPGYDFITDPWRSRDGGGRDSDANDAGDWASANDCGAGEDAESSSWHGTHVAGTVAAQGNNGTGVTGVAFKAKVVPVRALGRCGGMESDIADAVIWAAGGSVPNVPANANKARVINMSLGAEVPCSATYQAAIDKARNLGALVVVSAGNDNKNAGGYSPASCKGVLTVAATTKSGAKASYSNFGSVVGIAAPGGFIPAGGDATGGVLSTFNTGTMGPAMDTTAWGTGTSMAAPHVSGVAALMLASNIYLTGDMAARLIKETARKFPGTCSGCGTGIVDAAEAVKAARGFMPEHEPNNQRTSAQYLNRFPADVWGYVSESQGADNDWYSVSLPRTRCCWPNSTRCGLLRAERWYGLLLPRAGEGGG